MGADLMTLCDQQCESCSWCQRCGLSNSCQGWSATLGLWRKGVWLWEQRSVVVLWVLPVHPPFMRVCIHQLCSGNMCIAKSWLQALVWSRHGCCGWLYRLL